MLDRGDVFHGMDINVGTTLSDPGFNKRVIFENCEWSDKYYFFLIPQNMKWIEIVH